MGLPPFCMKCTELITSSDASNKCALCSFDLETASLRFVETIAALAGVSMPKYFFDIVENDHIAIDHEGQDLSDASQAHREAVLTIAAMAAEEIPKDGRLQLTVAVADETHHVLFRTHVTFEPGLPKDGLKSA